MDERKQIIIRAAQKLFLKYGYNKVTMGDIAEASGLSRPLLYLSFEGKEDIFDNVIKQLAVELSEKANQEVATVKDPFKKLDQLFQIWILQIQEKLYESEEAKELYESNFPFVQDTMDEVNKMFRKDIENILNLFPKDDLNGGLSPEEMARIYSNAVAGFKKNCNDIFELESQIKLLIKATIRT